MKIPFRRPPPQSSTTPPAVFLDTVLSLPGVIATAGTPRPPVSPSVGALLDQCASWTIRHSTARHCSSGPAILRTSFNRLHKGLQDQSSSSPSPTHAPPQPDSSQFSVALPSKTISSQDHGGTGYNKSLKNRNLQMIAADDSERQDFRGDGVLVRAHPDHRHRALHDGRHRRHCYRASRRHSLQRRCDQRRSS